MNSGVLEMLTAGQAYDLRRDVSRLLTDPEIGGVACVFRARGTHAVSFASGTASDTETLTSITAMISPMSEREIAANEVARRGDVEILIAVGQLTTAPRVDDTVTATVSGKRYHVLSAAQSGMATHYALMGREA